MGRKLPRNCPRCRKEVDWEKMRRPGANYSTFQCLVCLGPTKPLSGHRKRSLRTPRQKERRRKERRAEFLWRHLIYATARPPGSCAVCGTTKGLQAMHLFPKGKYRHLKFALENGAPGCAGCHHRLTNDHERHRDFCIRYLGMDRYEQLRLRSLSKEKADLDAILDVLEEEHARSPDVPEREDAGDLGP